MHIQGRERTAVMAGAIGMAALVLARPWRRLAAGYNFSGRTVVITGGSRGLGLVLARLLAGEGAKLALVARDEEGLDRAAADIQTRQPGTQVLPLQGDVRRRYEAERTIARVMERFGGVDVLINNAGIIQVGPVDHMKLADYDDAMNTHFWGPLYMIGAALPHMKRSGGGRIVNISSIGGKISVPHLVPYSASKFALVGLSEGLRAELARHDIVVTTVCPGLMRTGSPLNALFKGQRREEYAWFTISGSLPIASIDARRAARQIVEACRRGDAELIITLQAKAAVLLRHIAPQLFSDVMTLVNKLLPAPARGNGDEAQPGRENESEWAAPRSPLTAPTYRAAARNNEL